MKLVCIVGLGGALGAILRYLLGNIVGYNSLQSFPWVTLGINILGSFILGIVACYYPTNSAMYTFLGVGICGGFTTFSTFSNQTFTLFINQQYFLTFAYIAASISFGCLAFFLGFQANKI